MGLHLSYDGSQWQADARSGSFPLRVKLDILEFHNATTQGAVYAVSTNLVQAGLAIGHRVAYSDLVAGIVKLLNDMQSAPSAQAKNTARVEFEQWVGLVLCKQAAVDSYEQLKSKIPANKKRYDEIITSCNTVADDAAKQAPSASNHTQKQLRETLSREANKLVRLLNNYVPNLDLSDAGKNSAIHDAYDARYQKDTNGKYSLTPRSRDHLTNGDFTIPVSPKGKTHYTSHTVGNSNEMGAAVRRGDMSPKSKDVFDQTDKHVIQKTTQF